MSGYLCACVPVRVCRSIGTFIHSSALKSVLPPQTNDPAHSGALVDSHTGMCGRAGGRAGGRGHHHRTRTEWVGSSCSPFLEPRCSDICTCYGIMHTNGHAYRRFPKQVFRRGHMNRHALRNECRQMCRDMYRHVRTNRPRPCATGRSQAIVLRVRVRACVCAGKRACMFVSCAGPSSSRGRLRQLSPNVVASSTPSQLRIDTFIDACTDPSVWTW